MHSSGFDVRFLVRVELVLGEIQPEKPADVVEPTVTEPSRSELADIPVLTVHWSLPILMPAFQQATPKRREERTGIVRSAFPGQNEFGRPRSGSPK